MVKRFFGSIVRIAVLIIMCAVAAWGIAQAFVDLPYASEINKYLLVAFSAIVVWNIKEIVEDFAFWFRQLDSSYSANANDQE